MKKLLWLPGYILIGFLYFFPSEWGKNRNVSRGSRWWNHREALAPIFSIIFYIVFLLIIVMIISNKNTSTGNNPPSSPNQYVNKEPEVKEKDKLPVTIKEELPKITQDYSTKNDMDNTTSSLEEIFNPPLEDLKAEVINEPEKESTKICPIPGHC